MNILKNCIVLQLMLYLVISLTMISCSGYGEKNAEMPAMLPGKWQLLRIEDPYKIVVPPTDVIRVELEFSSNHFAATGSGAGIKGNTLSGRFTGMATYSTATLEGALDVGELYVNEDVLLARYQQFDDYYLQQLARAASYCIEGNKLIVRSGDRTELIYAWLGDN